MPNQPSCSNCKTELIDIEKFCQNCGFPENGDEKEKAKFNFSKKLKQDALEEAEGKLKKVKIMLYILAAINLFGGIYWMQSEITYWDGIVGIICGIVFIGCAIWVNKQPLIGVISAMIFYILLQLTVVLEDPLLLFKGIILKVIIISLFIKGIQSAKDVKEFRDKLAAN